MIDLTERRQQDLLKFYLQRMSLPLFALLQLCISIVISGEIAPGYFFCHADQIPISVYQFNVARQQCCSYCGLDSSRYKSHSFRIGGACHAAETGYSDAQIRPLGRWKSYAFKVYLRSKVLHAN